MSGMGCFYSAPYKPCSEGKNVHFLLGGFLLLNTVATEHFVASFLQKSLSVLASGEALQDHLCCMDEGVPRAWCLRCRGFAASWWHILNTREWSECIRWRCLQNNVQFNRTQRNATCVPQEGSGIQTEAWWVGATGRLASKTHCRSDLRGYGRHILWEDHLFYRWRNHTHGG